MGRLLNASTSMQCPHGATITGIPSQSFVMADGVPVLVVSDQCVVAGCPYQIPAAPSPIPSPCLSVVWSVPMTTVMVNGVPALNEDSVGLCIGLQGVQGQVQVVNTQSVASGS